MFILPYFLLLTLYFLGFKFCLSYLKIIDSYKKQVKRAEVFVENTVLHAEILQLLDLKGKLQFMLKLIS